jgi:hypothetical protein
MQPKKIMFILLILSLLSLICCEYKELKKHSSVKVIPDTKVYLDLSNFETGDLISFEIEMDLFFGGQKSFYNFYIDQVPASLYYEPTYWNNLREVKNENVSCGSNDVCTFKWEEIKKEGNKYIFIKTPAPFDNFYSFWGNKIKIENVGGKLSVGAIIGIVFGVIVFIAIFVVIISCCCCYCSQTNRCNRCSLCCPCCNCCCCRRMYYPTTIHTNIPYQQQVYPAPVPVPVAVSPAYNPAPAYPVPGQVYPQAQPVYSAVPAYV